MPVWSSQGTLSGPGQEHEPVAGDVCHVEPVDGAKANIAGAAGMSAPEVQAKALKQAQTVKRAKNRLHIWRQFRHVNIHASTRAAAGVMQTIPRSKRVIEA